MTRRRFVNRPALVVSLLAMGLFPAVGLAGHGTNDHWSDLDGNIATVTLVDFTGAAWPVSGRSGHWDGLGANNVAYSFEGPCSLHCVSVNTKDDMGGCSNPPIFYGYTAQGLTDHHMTSDLT